MAQIAYFCKLHISAYLYGYNVCLFAAFDDFEDDEPDSGGIAPDADPLTHPPPDAQDLQQPVVPINPGRAQLDIHKVMLYFQNI